jgi:hypothetical protein
MGPAMVSASEGNTAKDFREAGIYPLRKARKETR